MISIIITSYKEPKTIGKAIEAFLNQSIKEKYEIIISAPDKETLDVAKKYQKKNKNIKLIEDSGKGKPSALNLIFKKVKSKILVLTDGDVYVGKNSVNLLIDKFKDKKVGAVTGRPISINPKNTIFGYWAYLLTQGMHFQRLNEAKKEKNIICSGYLYAIKNFKLKLPENILADDAFISFSILGRGYKTIYEPRAEVYVKYPSNLPDWIRQKKRTASKYYQLKNYFKISKEHSFKYEVVTGIKTIKLISSIKELFWFVFLVIMRFYLWFRIFFDFRLWKRGFIKTWERVESTK